MKRLSISGRIKEWFLDLFFEEYELKIWFHKETEITEHGLKRATYSDPKIFLMSRLDKLSQNHIKGKDINGNPLEIKTTEPFNYNITKTR